MVWAVSDCPGTEQNINIKGGTRGNKNLDIGSYFYEIYIFVIFNAVTSSVTWPERTEV